MTAMASRLFYLYLFLLTGGSASAHSTLPKTSAILKYCRTRANKDLPTNCLDYLCRGDYESRLYKIYPNGQEYDDLKVYCDQETDGGGWLVFQRRMDGSVDFFRGWESYKLGFGNKENGEFWLGNDLIHEFSRKDDQTLRVDMEAVDGNAAYAGYNSFFVSSEEDNYRLKVEGYSGTAGDALITGGQPANGMQFSTKDRDHDIWINKNCAVVFTGAWWYKDCHESNLNGRYLNGTTGIFAQGAVWKPFKGYYNSLKTTEMKMRPTLSL